MTLQQIKYFLEVAKTKRFTTAAQNMFIAQSSLSHAIQELEHEIGVPLFVRNMRKDVLLTEYGEKFYPYAEKLLSVLTESEAAMKTLKDPYSGTVRIGFYYCVASNEIPEICRSFYAENPNNDLFIDVNVYSGEELIDDQLMLGKYDLVISTSEDIHDCKKMKIGSQDIKVMVANTHHLAKRESVRLEDLDGEPIVGFSPNSNLDKHLRKMFKYSGLKPDLSYVSDWSTQAVYIALNYGVAITPSLPLCTDHICELKLDHPMKTRDLNLFWPVNRRISKAAEYVRDYIIDYSQKNPIR